jgi:ribosomal protein L22
MEAVARLRNLPTSPRKMRLLADLIRGMEVENALNTLKFQLKTQFSATGKAACKRYSQLESEE